MTGESTNAVEVFFSFAHEDERLRKTLDKHLGTLKRQDLIKVWYDCNINAGTEWAQEINSHLKTADIILLLISPDFIASDYCYSIEMKRALERHEAEEARVIPIILRPVDLQKTPFSKLKALPLNAKPITTWQNRDKAFLDVADGIRNAINDLHLSCTQPPSKQLWNVPFEKFRSS